MTSIRMISTSTIKADSSKDSTIWRRLDLSPWDLQLLLMSNIQKGILFHKPKPPSHNIDHLIQHLKTSLSRTLGFFPPLAGRLATIEHDNEMTSFFIDCNNSGVDFVHAVADGVTIADILEPTYVPTLVYSFFTLNGVLNYDGVSKPLLGIQVTELVDGIFIGCSINHSVADGTTFWNFFNSWSEVSRGFNVLSKPPCFNREFLNDFKHPIQIPFLKIKQETATSISPHLRDRVFHFTKERVVELKSKANAEMGTIKISSLQALLAHIWKSYNRNRQLNPDQEVGIALAIGVRRRLASIIPQQYFGNSVAFGVPILKVRDLLENGIGYSACEMNKEIASFTEEKMLNLLESWIHNPIIPTLGRASKVEMLGTSSSPWFDVYGNDFGWGNPIAVRSGSANKVGGKLTFFEGVEKGSIDVEACLPFDVLEAMGSDREFDGLMQLPAN